MRIQHNIMALNAYRNYTTNASALQKNLERLSSGYKINRAGDDAAGLAISEKMRAQITGLQVAQKNAKDGISLVQTAEGALTEVHDMLNRMVELATQSANGTYSSDTDRVQLQKEMDQLRAEIDRIADSANFNGIQLLDGNMDAGGDVVYTKGAFVFEALHPAGTGSFPLLPPLAKDSVEPARGTDTILHTEGTKGGDKNMFSVDFENLELNKDGKIDITLGDNLTITVENKTGDAVSADDIVSAIAKGGVADAGGTSGISVVFKKGDTVLTPGVAEDGVTKTLTLGETVFEMSANGSRLTFKQTSDDKGIDMPQNVTIANSGDQYVWGEGKVSEDAVTGITVTTVQGGAGTDPKDFDWTGNDTSTLAGSSITVEVGDSNHSYTINLVAAATGGEDPEIVVSDALSGAELLAAIQTKVEELCNNAAGGETAPAGAGETFDGIGNLKITVGTTGLEASAKKATFTSEKVKDCFSGDWNVGITDIETKFEGTQDRLASTVLTLREDMYAEGSTITIGRDTYTFTTDKTKLGKDGYVVYNKGEDAAAIAVKLTEAAKNNGTYTVGHDKDGRITLLEKEGQTNFDLTTMAGIERSLGFKTAAARGTDTSKGLTLQIGDTAQSYNQLKVNIKDCHTKALGLDTVSIANQADAGGAVDLINEAINYISDVRGTLGATQNRLDHTINNLSVMTENIQDAESTIRDTDIAEEMMAYTKNNILIQAAQAMLAQANQVPQGVLQLLQ